MPYKRSERRFICQVQPICPRHGICRVDYRLRVVSDFLSSKGQDTTLPFSPLCDVSFCPIDELLCPVPKKQLVPSIQDKAITCPYVSSNVFRVGFQMHPAQVYLLCPVGVAQSQTCQYLGCAVVLYRHVCDWVFRSWLELYVS